MKANTARDSGRREQERPSLYSFNRNERDAGKVFSILDALEPQGADGPLWWRAALVGLIVLLAAALYLVGRNVDVHRRISPVAAEDASSRHTGTGPATAPVAAAPAAAGEPGVTAIVVEAPLHHAELHAPEPPGVPAGSEQAAAAEGDPLLAFVAGHAKASADTQPHGAIAATVEGRAAGEVPALARKDSVPAPATAKAAAMPEKGKDRDVDLIAALVTHVSRSGAPAGDVASRAGRRAAPDAGKRAPARKERRADARRDIVVREDGESTGALVGRCRALGLIEGELCRLRICSGLWGRDPACPGTPSSDTQSVAGG